MNAGCSESLVHSPRAPYSSTRALAWRRLCAVEHRLPFPCLQFVHCPGPDRPPILATFSTKVMHDITSAMSFLSFSLWVFLSVGAGRAAAPGYYEMTHFYLVAWCRHACKPTHYHRSQNANRRIPTPGNIRFDEQPKENRITMQN